MKQDIGELRVESALGDRTEPIAFSGFRILGHNCVRHLWCQYYSKLKVLKPCYTRHNKFFEDVSHFTVSWLYKSVAVHFKRTSVVYSMCVCPEPHERVVERGGFHASDGHRATLCFGQDKVCYVSCYDSYCQGVVGNKLGIQVFQIPNPLLNEAMQCFSSEHVRWSL